MRTREEVDHAFTYHPPRNEDEITFYGTFRARVHAVALDLVQCLPECAERTLAIRHLEQAVMYGNAAVARHGIKPEVTNGV